MVWGTKAGVTDLVQKLQQHDTKSMYILSTRKITTEDAVLLAEALKTHPIMEEFNISGHNIGRPGLDAFADVLATNTSLLKIAVGTNSLGDEGVSILCEGLARNPLSRINTLDVEFKDIGDPGATAIGAMLRSNRSILELNLARNHISAVGFDALVAGIRATSILRVLDMSENAIQAAPSLSQWLKESSCSLQILVMDKNSLIGDGAAVLCEALSTNMSLKELNLSMCQLSEAAWIALGNALATNTTLRKLNLSYNVIPTGSSFDAIATGLSQNQGVCHLVLAHTNLGNTNALRFSQLSRKLTFLDVSGNGLTWAGMQPLVSLPALQELRLFDNSLGDGIIHIVDAIAQNTSLRVLDIGANGLHGVLAVTLFHGLANNATLKTLEVGGNDLGEIGLEALGRLRAVNPSLDVAIDKRSNPEEQ
jgi:Ran GTPase-activating protein (RanGAP) involved in mRNA processing and transport